MILTRYSPDREFNTLHHPLYQLLTEVLPANRSSYSPAVEVSETENSIEICVELPGIDIKDVEVEVTKNMVSIRGERKRPEENAGTKVSEFRYGKFGRLLPLTARVQNTAVTANYQNGILFLTLPKAEEEKNKVVKVNLVRE
jgi:HSP20 family protein